MSCASETCLIIGAADARSVPGIYHTSQRIGGIVRETATRLRERDGKPCQRTVGVYQRCRIRESGILLG